MINSCRMPVFCAGIVLAFISGMKLFDYVVDGGGGSSKAWLGGESQVGHMASR